MSSEIELDPEPNKNSKMQMVIPVVIGTSPSNTHNTIEELVTGPGSSSLLPPVKGIFSRFFEHFLIFFKDLLKFQVKNVQKLESFFSIFCTFLTQNFKFLNLKALKRQTLKFENLQKLETFFGSFRFLHIFTTAAEIFHLKFPEISKSSKIFQFL